MTRLGDRGVRRNGPSPLESLRRALILLREIRDPDGHSRGEIAPRLPSAAEAERWRSLHNAALERSTSRGWRKASHEPPAVDVIGGALVEGIEHDFEVAVQDRMGADTGLRARFSAREAPRLVRSGRSATLFGSFGAVTKAIELRFSVRADAIDSIAPRRVTWVAPVRGSRCDLAAAAPVRGKSTSRSLSRDGRPGDTIAYLDPRSIEVTRVVR
jgi:hypothetical protein